MKTTTGFLIACWIASLLSAEPAAKPSPGLVQLLAALETAKVVSFSGNLPSEPNATFSERKVIVQLPVTLDKKRDIDELIQLLKKAHFKIDYTAMSFRERGLYPNTKIAGSVTIDGTPTFGFLGSEGITFAGTIYKASRWGQNSDTYLTRELALLLRRIQISDGKSTKDA